MQYSVQDTFPNSNLAHKFELKSISIINMKTFIKIVIAEKIILAN